MVQLPTANMRSLVRTIEEGLKEAETIVVVDDDVDLFRVINKISRTRSRRSTGSS
jgi:hypothetical protein